MSQCKYRHIMLKLSGEMLGGQQGYGIEGDALLMIANEIADAHALGCKVSVVIGGGNIFRGSAAARWGIERASADYMGMLATIINGLALQATLENKFNLNTRVMTSISMPSLAEPYIRRKAIKHLDEGRVVIFAGGTGNPLFTTDTAASLRAREVGADIILKATKVDGIYDSDPMKNPGAKKYAHLSYLDVIARKLDVMDATAITMCMEANLPIMVFKLAEPGSVRRALVNDGVGTTVN
ncbi:MAG: UMP kinase [Deltaproteobacteria bacterium]|nr:UMP kinase [Deltaproteobacteria bacterium]